MGGCGFFGHPLSPLLNAREEYAWSHPENLEQIKDSLHSNRPPASDRPEQSGVVDAKFRSDVSDTAPGSRDLGP